MIDIHANTLISVLQDTFGTSFEAHSRAGHLEMARGTRTGACVGSHMSQTPMRKLAQCPTSETHPTSATQICLKFAN